MALTTTQLTLTNGALRHLGQRKITDVNDTGEPATVLRDLWQDGLVDDCLGNGQWLFATRTDMYDFSPSIVPTFGYTYAFDKPEDWVRTTGIWVNPSQSVPLVDYSDEAGYWFTYVATIYVSFISNASNYGGDMARWPEQFCRWLEAYWAWRACYRLTQDQGKTDRLEKMQEKLLVKARSLNAQGRPTSFPPNGGWTNARLGGWGVGSRGGGNWL